MRSRSRSLAASLALAILVLGIVASTAFAAGGAQPGRYTFGDDYCFVDGSSTYCFEQDGSVHSVVTPDGREIGTINFRQTTTFFENGVYVGESRQVSVDKLVFDADGRTSFTSVSHTNTRLGDTKCVLTTVLKIVDFEVQVDHWNAPACS
ncbi:MAG: hypothetical protein ACJ77B_06810 [Chloroflexota bacterium]